MDEQTISLTILGMMLVTYLPRLLPVWMLQFFSLPPLLAKWLRFIPAAVLAAMLFPSIFLHKGQIDFSPANLFFWASIPTMLVAWKTRNLYAPVIVGMLSVAACRYFFAL